MLKSNSSRQRFGSTYTFIDSRHVVVYNLCILERNVSMHSFPQMYWLHTKLWIFCVKKQNKKTPQN